ncbi:TPA: acyltransferase [Escherichia coli]|nr:acyltransferase [Escherichia coli]
MSKNRLHGLDAWRGVAAIMVAIYHFNVNSFMHELTIVKNSWLFVEFFFVLSGFIMMYNYSDRINNREQLLSFLFKRFSRIWPLHIFVLFLFVPVAIAGYVIGNIDPSRFSVASFISNVFLIQSLGVNDGVTWNSPSWSISSEFFVYVAFGLITLIFTKGWCRFIIPSLICFVILTNFSNMGDAYKLAFFRCGYSFFIGCVVYYLYKSKSLKSGTWLEILSVVAVVLTMSLFLIKGNDLIAYCIPFLFCAIVFSFARGDGVISKAMENNLFIKMGEVSYSIYMTHAFVAICIKSLLLLFGKFINHNFLVKIGNETQVNLGGVLANNLLDIVFLVLVISFSMLTYRYVESPCQRILNAWYKNKKMVETSNLVM